MAMTIDPALAERLRNESEQTKDDVYPAGATGRRPPGALRLTAHRHDDSGIVPRLGATRE